MVYRPAPSCKHGLRYEDFAVEWTSYIDQFVEVQEELLIVGDFNIHVDSSINESQSFLDILKNANGLIQHVKSSTHQKKHIQDLLLHDNSTLQKLTDKYAPLQCETISLRPHAPWYTSALRQEKRVRRRSERVAARTMLEVGPTDSSGYIQKAK